jgi:putative transcriptional regulator
MLHEFKQLKTEGYLTGQLLVALPQLQDPRFHQAVVLICGHDEQGAMGLVLNKVIDTLTLKDLLVQLKIEGKTEAPSLPVFYGGPVEMGRGFVLHSLDFMSELSVKISDDFALSATVDVIEAIAQSKGPKDKILALGYAGWSPNQLEGELLAHSWLCIPADAKLVFEIPRQELWKKALDKLGIDPNHLSTHVGNA